MITVRLPVDLAAEFRTSSLITVEAENGAEMLQSLDEQYPGIASWLAESNGCFRENLSVFVSGRRLEPRANISVAIAEGSEVWILRAISGG